MIKVIAFDLDDTLWAVDPVILRAERELSSWLRKAAPGVRYDTDTLRALREELVNASPDLAGRVTEMRRRVIQEMLSRNQVPCDQAERLSSQAMEVFLSARNQIDLFEGALDALNHLSARFRLGALSNGNADIERLGLSKVFSFAYCAEQVGAPKPAPDLFLTALAHTQVAPAEMIYVGDHPLHDVDAANRVGLRTIWVDNGIKQREPGRTRPDETVRDIREVPQAVERLISRF